MDKYAVAKNRALNAKCYYNNAEYKVEHFIDDEDLIFICFLYNKKELETYYKKEYITDCIKSWQKIFPDSKVLYIQVKPGVSLWTDWCIEKGKTNYPTDSLRLLYCSLFKRACYLDTDVFLNFDFIYNGQPKTFIVDNCSGTCLYQNGEIDGLIKWFNWYEEDCLELSKKTFYTHIIGDVEAYQKTKFIPSLRLNLDHFSKLYCFKRDNKPIRFVEWDGDTTINYGRLFSKECYPTLLKYLKEKQYILDNEKGENIMLR